MQKTINASYLDWTREAKPKVKSRGIASIVAVQMNSQASSIIKGGARCIWPSGFENVDSRYLSRRVWSR